jgi:AcrR family transcriptional regulator
MLPGKRSTGLNVRSTSKGAESVEYATGAQKVTKNADDLRVRRTRALLQKALIDLTIEKGFTEVTVRDITQRAMVNRSTFYHHYLDKYDLLRQYIEEVIALLYVEESDPALGTDGGQPSAGLVRILQHVQTNAEFYRVLLGKKGDPAFCAQSFRKFIERQFRHILPVEGMQADPSRPPIELSVSYILHAGIGAILWWLENDQPCSPEQVAIWLNQFSRADMAVSFGVESKTVSRH